MSAWGAQGALWGVGSALLELRAFAFPRRRQREPSRSPQGRGAYPRGTPAGTQTHGPALPRALLPEPHSHPSLVDGRTERPTPGRGVPWGLSSAGPGA